MEAFSLLKYWRGGGGVVFTGAGPGAGAGAGDSCVNNSRATTIVTAVETDDNNDDDDGPFFDLEFSVPDEEEGEEDAETKELIDAGFEDDDDVDSDEEDDDDEGEGEGEVTDGEREFKFALSSGSGDDGRADQNLPLSPSDDLFFKGRLVPIEPSSLVLNGSEPSSKPQFPVSFLKSATKLRVFMLGFKKSKMNAMEAKEAAASTTSPKRQQQKREEKEKGEETNTKQRKLFTVKFKVEEVPIVSLFTRDNSKSSNKSQKQSNTEESVANSDEKRFSKDVMQKYLKKVKPLYIRVSKRYGEKLRFSGQPSLGSGPKAAAVPPPTSTVAATQESSPSKSTSSTDQKSQAGTEAAEASSASNVKSLKQAGLRVVCKHLGKSRSASSAAVAAVPPAPAVSRRRDDSLLQQQDGIQSAILHCKRSFNASRDSDSSLLSRSVSDPSHEKSLELTRKSAGGGKVSTLRELNQTDIKSSEMK